MKKYEYKVKFDVCAPFSGYEKELLKESGDMGWELVFVLQTAPTTTYNKMVYYFKREVK